MIKSWDYGFTGGRNVYTSPRAGRALAAKASRFLEKPGFFFEKPSPGAIFTKKALRGSEGPEALWEALCKRPCKRRLGP